MVRQSEVGQKEANPLFGKQVLAYVGSSGRTALIQALPVFWHLKPKYADEVVRRALWLPRACWSYAGD